MMDDTRDYENMPGGYKYQLENAEELELAEIELSEALAAADDWY